MASFNFGGSGEAAVTVVVGKAKAEAAHAKKVEADAAESAAGAEKEKAALKNLSFHKLQHDNGIRSIEIELKRLREVLIKLRGEEKMLKDIGQDGRHLIQLSEEQRELRLKQLSEDRREFRQQQKKLREEEAKLRQQQKEFYLERRFPAAEEEEPEVPSQGLSVQGNDKRQVYVVKGTKQSSDVGLEAEHKPAEEASTKADADANPSSGSEKSSAAGNNGHDGSTFQEKKLQKNYLSGSQKRKKRNAAKKNSGNEVDKSKKQDSSKADVSKKTDKKSLASDYPREEEKMTLAEYEKIRQEKKKSSEDVSRTERKVSADEFKGLQMLEKKKLDDEEAVMKAEKVQKKDVDVDAAKPKKALKIPLKDLSFAPPKRVVIYEDGSSNRGRFNGGYQSRNHDNGRAAQNEAGNYGNGSTRGGYSGGRGIGAPSPRGGYSGGRGNPRGDYSGGRGNGGYGAPYSGVRGDGGYGAPRGDYSGSHGDGYSGGGNGGYHNQGNNGRGNQRRQGNDNYYRPRGRGYSGNGRSPAPNPKDMNLFPQLPASAPA